MGRAGEAPIVEVGPVERALVDPQSMMETKVTAQVRVLTDARMVRTVVESQRAAGDLAAFRLRVVEVVTQAIFASVTTAARQASCSVLDAIGPALRRDVESALLARLGQALAPLGLGVVAIEGLSLTMDPSTETWLRTQRSSSRMRQALAAEPIDGKTEVSPPIDEATAVAGSCAQCGTQVAVEEKTCPACGGAVKPPPPCVFCGSEIRPGSRFCVRCGARAFILRPAARR